MIETLEHRLLFAATFDKTTGLLTVTGTNNADTISIANKNPAIVLLNGKKIQEVRPATQIKSIVIYGLNGADRIISSLNVPTTVYGGAGADWITTAGGKDFLYGDAGNDKLEGLANDDWLQGGTDNDDMFGGTGFDTVDYSDHTFFTALSDPFIKVTFDNSANDGTNSGGTQIETDNVRTDNENFNGSEVSDVVTGQNGVSHNFTGNGGDDSLVGGDKADVLIGGAGNDSLEGNLGDDVLLGGANDDTINGGPEVLPTAVALNAAVVKINKKGPPSPPPPPPPPPPAAPSDKDFIVGGSGEDNLNGNADADNINGGDNDDDINGGGGDDQITGDEGGDNIDAGDGDDTVQGGNDSDTIEGGLGNDSVNGDDGDDVITDAGEGTSEKIQALIGGTGADNISATTQSDLDTSSSEGVSTSAEQADPHVTYIQGGDDNDTMEGGEGNEVIDGELGDDTAIGNDGNDTISGGFGSDNLQGGNHNDVFINDDGEPDVIDGGDGIDFVQEDQANADASDNTEITTDQAEGIEAPTDLTADPFEADGYGGAILNWVDNSTAEDGYIVQQSVPDFSEEFSTSAVGPGYIWIDYTFLEADATTYTLSQLSVGHEYSFRVVAYQGTRQAASEPVTFFTPVPANTPVYFESNGHYYERIDSSLTWDDANALAQSSTFAGTIGHLVTITSEEENLFLTKAFGNDGLDLHWTGAIQPGESSEPDGGWSWVTDESFSFLGWAPGEPNNLFGDENRALFGQPVQSWGKPWVDTRGDEAQDGLIIEYEFNNTIGGGLLGDKVPSAPVSDKVGTLATQNGGTINVSGTTGVDTIEIWDDGTNIQVWQDGVQQAFSRGSVTGISIDVGGGNDKVNVQASVTKPCTIAGGSGNDGIGGGAGADVIGGGTGNDNISGGKGNDSLDGSDGDDCINGGNATTATDDGKDTIVGGAGAGDYADYSARTASLTLSLDGVQNDGSEADWIKSDVENLIGGKGNDTLRGNAGANFITGGAGSDRIVGNGGNDQLAANKNESGKIDSVFGNAGADYFFIQDVVRDDYFAITGTDFFTPDSGVDVKLAADQT